MKSLFKCLALLGVLLLTASPTVKAGEPSKPTVKPNTLSVSVIKIVGSTNVFLYTNGQILSVVNTSIPDKTYTSFSFMANNPLYPWLVFEGYDTDSLYHVQTSIALKQNGIFYDIIEFDPDRPVPLMGHCSGLCGYPESSVCNNTSEMVMVRCECVYKAPESDDETIPLAWPQGGCKFTNISQSNLSSIVSLLKELPPQGQ